MQHQRCRMTLDTGAKHSWLNRPTLDHNKRVLTIQQASADNSTSECWRSNKQKDTSKHSKSRLSIQESRLLLSLLLTNVKKLLSFTMQRIGHNRLFKEIAIGRIICMASTPLHIRTSIPRHSRPCRTRKCIRMTKRRQGLELQSKFAVH